MNDRLEKIALDLFSHGSIKFSNEGFRFNLHKEHPEAPLSPNYLNLRDSFRIRETRIAIARELYQIIIQYALYWIKPDLLADLPQSISPIVTTLSDLSGIEMISIRSEALKGIKKDYGSGGSIMGKYNEGQTALIIDDVVSSLAFTKDKAAQVLKENNLKVSPYILVVVDREEGGSEILKALGYELVSLLKIKEIFQLYLQKKQITPELYEKSLVFSEIAKKYALGK